MPLGFQSLMRCLACLDIFVQKYFFLLVIDLKSHKARQFSLCFLRMPRDRCIYIYATHTFLTFVTFTPLNLMWVDVSIVQTVTAFSRYAATAIYKLFIWGAFHLPLQNNPRPESGIESHPLVRSHSNEKLRTKYRAGPKERRQSDTEIAQNKIGIVRWTTHIAGVTFLSCAICHRCRNRCHTFDARH